MKVRTVTIDPAYEDVIMTLDGSAESESEPDRGSGAERRSNSYPLTPRTAPTRHRERVGYDRAAVHAVLDEALVCHVGFVADDAPVVLPTIHTRVGETLYLHGSVGGRIATLGGAAICVTVTLLDGLVLARSWLHHSVPFRSVVAHGTARRVTDPDEHLAALAALMEHVAPGRSADSRPPNRKESAAVAVVALDLTEVSLKTRDQQVGDDPADLDGPYWAGVVPLRLTAAPPIPAPTLRPGIPTPAYASAYRR